VDVGEALGLYHAIWWIHDLQLSNADYEFYSKRVVDDFNGIGDLTEFEAIMTSSIQFCNIYLQNFDVEFIMCQANEVAHALARDVTSSPNFHILIDELTCINDLIANEML
jgi:hypothetical protein